MPIVGKTIEQFSLCGGVATMVFTDGTQAVTDGTKIDLLDAVKPGPVVSVEYPGDFRCPDSSSGSVSYWRVNNTCNYCGSWHPDLFMAALENQTIELIPTDKSYKVGINGLDSKIDAIKFYWYHLSADQQHQFIKLYNQKGKILLAYPGHLYQPPFFCKQFGE